MAKVDWTYLQTTNKILKEGSWDTQEKVRPKWEDGTPAHTAKIFAVNNVYKKSDGFPISTLRFTNWRAAIDEVQWIWQMKDNNVKNLHSHIWDQWADENGSIGKAYGWQVAQKSNYVWGEADQTDMLLYYLKNQPAFRSMVTELFKHEDLQEMGLYPCVHGMQLDVTDGKLNMFLNQRSNDTLAAGNWNPVQYFALLEMFAKVSGLEAGTLSHMIVNSHLYDRHVPFVVDMTLSRAKKIQSLACKYFYSIQDYDKAVISMSFEERPAFREFVNKLSDKYLCGYSVSYDDAIKRAKELEVENDKYDTKFYQKYTAKILESTEFKRAEYIIDTMAKHPEFEKAFGFCSPKLVLDPKVTDFYDFKSPLTTDKETGKFVASKDSSFEMQDYNWKEEGIKFEAKVPVAE